MNTTKSQTSDCPGKMCARDRILAAAADLFYREGIRAVGIEAVIEKAGVAKMSLYRSFPSKDDLVAAFLADRNRRYWLWWDEIVAAGDASPRVQLSNLFKALSQRVSSPDYRGCAFVNTAIEFPDPSHPGHAVALANKRELRHRLTLLTSALGVASAQSLADQLMLLMEGAYSLGNTLGRDDSPVTSVTAAAEALIDAAVRN
ncbi:TetR/AcrR family transcriptional regulator [Magnetospirillum molischianum]|uniref:Transcriptional regulator n=1 Tax=Magnetospirillum molischianum DSM 120 TaxID=1150626 RepID=H8FV20_MAGML|nr:TetR/AcrR family transcriptional regulator [Magnetospirillum molischianum]CCG42208.1 Transcriptional regulator [Magnetospirillum molischianum DSM 120]